MRVSHDTHPLFSCLYAFDRDCVAMLEPVNVSRGRYIFFIVYSFVNQFNVSFRKKVCRLLGTWGEGRGHLGISYFLPILPSGLFFSLDNSWITFSQHHSKHLLRKRMKLTFLLIFSCPISARKLALIQLEQICVPLAASLWLLRLCIRN